jgi:hypothetical protein
MDTNRHYLQGLQMLNHYLTARAQLAVSHTTPRPCFSGPRKSVLHNITCSLALRGNSNEYHEFAEALQSAETFYSSQSSSILKEYSDATNCLTLNGPINHLVSIFDCLIDPVPSNSAKHQAGRVMIGFVFLADLVQQHANSRERLDELAIAADIYLRRCVTFVVCPLGGWHPTVQHCLSTPTPSLWQRLVSYFSTTSRHG